MNLWKFIRATAREFFSPGFGLYDRLRVAGLERRIDRLTKQIQNRDAAIEALTKLCGTSVTEIARIQELHTGLMAEADRRYDLLLGIYDKGWKHAIELQAKLDACQRITDE